VTTHNQMLIERARRIIAVLLRLGEGWREAVEGPGGPLPDAREDDDAREAAETWLKHTDPPRTDPELERLQAEDPQREWFVSKAIVWPPQCGAMDFVRTGRRVPLGEFWTPELRSQPCTEVATHEVRRLVGLSAGTFKVFACPRHADRFLQRGVDAEAVLAS
jgi:hypothetical protein